MYYPLKDPPQWLLDGLLKEEENLESSVKCHDCGATVGSKHLEGCDTARCLATGDQRLCCDCGNCGEDIWTGKWPGTDEAYKYGLVCFDDRDGKICFDYNRVREIQLSSSFEPIALQESPREREYSEFLKEYEHSRDLHIAALGIPKELLGELSDNK
jgi:hypothetical protein